MKLSARQRQVIKSKHTFLALFIYDCHSNGENSVTPRTLAVQICAADGTGLGSASVVQTIRITLTGVIENEHTRILSQTPVQLL